MSDKLEIVSAIVAFLKAEKSKFTNLLKDKESKQLDEATNLICQVYGSKICDKDNYSDILKKFQKECDMNVDTPTTSKTVLSTEADNWKNKGNESMQQQNYEEAMNCYNKAIEINDMNPVFYCNKAAVLNKLKRYTDSIECCNRAIDIDQQYSKAYSRKALALVGISKYKEAVKCYEIAIKLEPDNASFKRNLNIAKSKLSPSERQDPISQMPDASSESQTTAASANSNSGPQAGNPFANLGNLGNIGSIMNNPEFMSTATRLLQDPNVQNSIASMFPNGDPSAAVGQGNVADVLSNFINDNPSFLSSVMGSFGMPNANNDTNNDNNSDDNENDRKENDENDDENV